MKYYFYEEFRIKVPIQYNLRNQDFQFQRVNSKYGTRLPAYFVPKFLNCMDESLLNIDKKYKSDLKSKLLECISTVSID